ncbi:MAG: alpha-2-macroglobulin [Pseudomonadota bacterium]
MSTGFKVFVTGLYFSILFFIQPLQAFDIEKAKETYKNASFLVSHVSEQQYESAPSINIKFSIPLQPQQNFQQYLTIFSPSVDTTGGWILSNDGKQLTYPFVEPNTRYEITIKPGIKSVTGKSIEKRSNFTLSTKKILPSVTFAHTGVLMNPLKKGFLPVTTVNVSEVDLDIHRIKEDEVESFFSTNPHPGRYSHRQLERLESVANFLHTGRYSLEAEPNQRKTINLNLSNIEEVKQPGIYLAVLRVPGQYRYQYDFTYFSVSDIGLQVRKYQKKMVVLAHSVRTGKPLSKVNVTLFSGRNTNNETVSAKTDLRGFAEFEITSSKTPHFILGKKETALSFVRVDRNALDLSGFDNPNTLHSNLQIMAYGPRDLYRPGEIVKINALLRDYDGKQTRDLPLRAILYQADGQKVKTYNAQTTIEGFYQFEYQLPENAKTGQWSLKLDISGGLFKQDYFFRVEEFLPERLELTVINQQKKQPYQFSGGKTLLVPIESRYLYGSPANGNKVDGLAFVKLNRHPFEHLKTYFFGNEKENLKRQKQSLDAITLNDEGRGELTIYNDFSELKSPLLYKVTASVYESGGRPVTRSALGSLIQTDVLIGIEPQFEREPNSNQNIAFKLLATDATGEVIQRKNVIVNLIHEDRNWYWEYSNSRGWYWQFSEEPYIAYSQTVELTEQPTLIDIPLRWGKYRLEVVDTSTDIRSTYSFQTDNYWWRNTENQSKKKPDAVHLAFSQDLYHPGDITELTIMPPHGGEALLTLESSEGVLFQKQLTVAAQGTKIEIPTKSVWNRHDIYASVLVLKPGDMQKTVSPKRAFGFTHLPMQRRNATFDITINVPEQVQPNRDITANIQLKTANGLIPNKTYITVALVDVGVLNITQFKTPQPQDFFFGARHYQVDIFDVYGNILENMGYESAKQRFGGGFSESEGELNRGGDAPKSEVKIVSLLSDPIPVNSDGRAVVGFTLPTFNGRLRWMVLAFSPEQFGAAQAETTVADKIITQMAMPRFLALNDQSDMAFDLRNMTDQQQSLSVKIETFEALEATTLEKNIVLEPQQKVTLKGLLTAKFLGQGLIKADIRNQFSRDNPLNQSDDKSVSIQREWRLGVRAAYPRMVRSESSPIKAGEQWSPSLAIDDLETNTINGMLSISNKAPINYQGHFNSLLNYPYGCIEQATSSGYPWVMVNSSMAEKMKLTQSIESRFKKPYSETFRKQQIENAIKKLVPRQKSHGGFGLWRHDSDEEYWLTVYAADFITDAAKEGADVPLDMKNKVISRLKRYLKGKGLLSNVIRRGNQPDEYIFASRAYAAYVLAKENRATLSDLRRLYEGAKGKYTFSGLPWMHLSVALKLSRDNRLAKEAQSLAMQQTQRNTRMYLSDYGSPLRDLALMTFLAQETGYPTADLYSQLSEALKNRKWLSTQEKNALFKVAYGQIRREVGDEWQAELVLDSQNQSLQKKDVFNTLFKAQQYQSLKTIRAFDNDLFVKLEVVGYPKTLPMPQSNTVNIRRNYYDLQGEPLSISELKQGDLVLVRLIASAEEFTPDGLIVDLLPAGFELENQNLADTSIAINDIFIEGKSIKKWYNSSRVLHQEYRDDRFVAAVELSARYQVQLFYLVRAVTPGSFNVPPPYIEDMYRPYRFAIGETPSSMRVIE